MGTFIKSGFTTTDLTAPVLVPSYLQDTFNRANGALGVTPGGKAWAQSGGTGSSFTIAGNRISTANPAASKAWLEDSHPDGVLSMTVSTYTSGLWGLSFRGTTGQDGEYVFYVGESGAGAALKKRTGPDAYTTLALGSPAIVPAAGQVLSVVLQGPSITCKVDGVTVVAVTDSTYTGNQRGLFSRNGTATADDFLYAPLP